MSDGTNLFNYFHLGTNHRTIELILMTCLVMLVDGVDFKLDC